MKYAILKLSGAYRETGPMVHSLLTTQSRRQFRFDNFLIRVEKILASRKIDTVLVDCTADFQVQLAGGAESIREQLLRLGETGRETLFYAAEYGPLQLYLASACRRRLIHPLGTVSFLGLSRSFLFFKSAADTLNIETTILRRGRYKSAGDRFRTERMDPFNREQYELYLETTAREMGEKTVAGIGKEFSELEEMIDGRILGAEEALKEGWVDLIKTAEQQRREWKLGKYKQHSMKKAGRSWGRGRRKIAILVFEGAIIDGKTRQHPLLGQAIGAESFVPHIRKLADDSSVKGVVFRINSGGGSATASEEVLNALAELQEKKPVVVSMAEVAASGGYWIGCKAERIFAQATSLTGSIGVISIHVALQKLLKRYGINAESLKTGPHADLGSALRSMTGKEKKMLDEYVDRLYRTFVEKVAGARNRTHREIEKVAAGRVWSGRDALRHHLVDEVGGLQQALDFMKERLKLPKARVVFYPHVKPSLVERLVRHSGTESGALQGASILSFVGAGTNGGDVAGGCDSYTPADNLPGFMPDKWAAVSPGLRILLSVLEEFPNRRPIVLLPEVCLWSSGVAP